MPAKAVKAPVVNIDAEVSAAVKALAPAVKRLTNALAKLDVTKLPIGAASDLLYTLRGTNKLVPGLSAPFDDVIGPKIKELEEYFIQSLKVGESSGVQGMLSRTQIIDEVIPVPENWAKIYAYAAKTKSWEIMNKALNRNAIRERWDAKKVVPGVATFHNKKVSCTKLGGKK